MDLSTMQVLATNYSDSNVNDCEVLNDLCKTIEETITNKIQSVRADGVYDTEEFRKII